MVVSNPQQGLIWLLRDHRCLSDCKQGTRPQKLARVTVNRAALSLAGFPTPALDGRLSLETAFAKRRGAKGVSFSASNFAPSYESIPKLPQRRTLSKCRADDDRLAGTRAQLHCGRITGLGSENSIRGSIETRRMYGQPDVNAVAVSFSVCQELRPHPKSGDAGMNLISCKPTVSLNEGSELAG